jgi:hypothetical protein
MIIKLINPLITKKLSISSNGRKVLKYLLTEITIQKQTIIGIK